MTSWSAQTGRGRGGRPRSRPSPPASRPPPCCACRLGSWARRCSAGTARCPCWGACSAIWRSASRPTRGPLGLTPACRSPTEATPRESSSRRTPTSSSERARDRPGRGQRIVAQADDGTGPLADHERTERNDDEGADMAYAGQTLDNPISGERITFRKTAEDTKGGLLQIDLELAHDGKVPGKHVHPKQEERFEVLSGTMKFKMGLKTVIAEAGDVVQGAFPPAWVQRATMAPLAAIARKRGHAERYAPPRPAFAA